MRSGEQLQDILQRLNDDLGSLVEWNILFDSKPCREHTHTHTHTHIHVHMLTCLSFIQVPLTAYILKCHDFEFHPVVLYDLKFLSISSTIYMQIPRGSSITSHKWLLPANSRKICECCKAFTPGHHASVILGLGHKWELAGPSPEKKKIMMHFSTIWPRPRW